MVSLVLGGGGARGAYQAGVLRRVAEIRPDLPFSILVGSSVGSVSIAYLASRAEAFAAAADSLARLWAEVTVDQVFRSDSFSLSWIGLRWLRDLAGGGVIFGARARSLLDTAPLSRLIMRHVRFEKIQPLIERGILHAVAVIATSYATGQSVTFVQGHPEIRPWTRPHRIAVLTRLGVEHVLASCAIPFVFPAVRVGAEHYGDGNVRLSYPFSPAAKLGASRIFAVSLRHPKDAAAAAVPMVQGYPPPAQVAGVLLNSVFLDSFDDDAAQLVRINSLLARGDGPSCLLELSPPLRPIDLFVIAPSRDLGRLASAYQHHFPPVVRWLLRGVGIGETRSADLVSYLLFDRAYTQALLEIGYADASAQAGSIERFLEDSDLPTSRSDGPRACAAGRAAEAGGNPGP